MKLRLATLLMLVSLLMMGSLASAANEVTAPAAQMTSMTPASQPPGCAADLLAQLPALTPEPSEKAATCGSCSVPVCQGQSTGNVCGYSSGKTYTCQILFGRCPAGGWECGCVDVIP
jgi:hypothetical protein